MPWRTECSHRASRTPPRSATCARECISTGAKRRYAVKPYAGQVTLFRALAGHIAGRRGSDARLGVGGGRGPGDPRHPGDPQLHALPAVRADAGGAAARQPGPRAGVRGVDERSRKRLNPRRGGWPSSCSGSPTRRLLPVAPWETRRSECMRGKLDGRGPATHLCGNEETLCVAQVP